MTLIVRLLEQKGALCARAFEHTQDLNEAHFLVHGVMARAFGRVGAVEPDLSHAMTDALDARARALFPTGAVG